MPLPDTEAHTGEQHEMSDDPAKAHPPLQVSTSTRRPFRRDELSGLEKWWADQYEWLKASGYELRPRYAPGWVASWLKNKKQAPEKSEDGIRLRYVKVIDATRTQDGETVMLKWTRKSKNPDERAVHSFFSEEPRVSDPHNHCLRLLDVLDVPGDDDRIILVMPLVRPHDSPRYDTVGEALACIMQVFEGVQYMHHQNSPHGDIKGNNIMMNGSPLYKRPFHPQQIDMTLDFKSSARHSTRTWNPVRYYLIDFGLSRLFDDPSPHLVRPYMGGVKEVPEIIADEPCDPLPMDIFCLGVWIQEDFLEKRDSLEFLEPFVKELTQPEASKRPRIDEAVARLSTLAGTLSSWKLRSRTRAHSDYFKHLRFFVHWPNRITYIITRTPAIPMP